MRNKGYTLIEVLIALAIFAVIGGVATQALIQTTKQQKIIVANQRNMKQIARAIHLLEQDVNYTIARPVSDLQKSYPAFIGSHNNIEFTKSNSPTNLAKHTNMKRVAWICENEKLIRRTWDLLDVPNHYAATSYKDTIILTPIAGCEMVFLDDKLQIQNTWPVLNNDQNVTTNPNISMPRALRFSITLPNLGEGDFLFLLSVN